MATGLANSTSLPNPTTRDDHAGERLIRKQLKRAGSYVKWIEAGSQLITLCIGTLAFFLAAALIDHWIMPLGWFGRWVLLIAYVGGCGWFLVTRMFPLVIRAVNPAYSARALEEATPSLKNSLVNFLFLKQDHAGVKQSVLDALEHRAASDISGVEIETAIDRAPLIRMAYVLCGVMALVAVYKIASPKDPFQTAARVVAPWADLARPARVIIREIQPGHTSVYLGAQVEVSAEVQGARAGDAVKLIYSSADGQVQDRVVLMKAAAGGRQFTATLPAEDENRSPAARKSPLGLQQGVQYHIEAGDAVSSIYEIRVRMAPTISVERAVLAFPAYTRKAPQTQETGEISALEGTRVTIHARANQPIKNAFLELDPRPGRAAETIPLQVEGQSAQGTFTLQLKADRTSPWRDSYQVRFTNEQGEISEQPVIHKLQVQADLPPEVQVLMPVQQKLDVPENAQLTIEVRGVDPDFALSELFVAGKTKDKPVFRQSFMPAGDQPSQASGKFEFDPEKLGLKAGAVITFQGVAVDNRREPLSGQPQPGRAESAEYTLTIVPARKGNAGGAEQPNNGLKTKDPEAGADNKPMPMPMNEGQGPQPPKPNEQPAGPNEQRPNEPKPNDENKQNKPDEQPMQSGQQNNESSSGQGNQGSGESSSQGKGNDSKQGKGGNDKGKAGQEGTPSEEQPMPMDSTPQDAGNSGSGQSESGSGNSGDGASGTSGSQAKPMGGQQPANGQGGAPGASTGQGQGANEGSQENPGQTTGQQGGASGRAGSGGDRKPEHDGEKFEEMLKHLRDKAKQSQNQQGGGQGGQEQPQGGAPQPSKEQPGKEQPGQGQPPMNAGGENAAGQNAAKPEGGKPEDKPAGGKPDAEKSAGGQPQQGSGQGNKDEVTAEELDRLKKLFGKEAVEKAEQKAREQGSQGNQGNQGSQGQGEKQPDGQPMGGQPMPGGQPSQGPQPQGGQQGAKEQPGTTPQGQPKTGPKPEESKSGSPQGPKPEGQGNQPMPGGEKKEPGAGQTGDSGAGEQSSEKTGSGQGQEQNRDKKKEGQPDNKKSGSDGPSTPSTSKKQSNSKGGSDGDQSGGGKQGGGQPGGKGNDTAGGSSAGDEGSGAAQEQGKGPTGTQGGQGEQQAPGKTGKAGQQPGNGSSKRPGEQGSEPGEGKNQPKNPNDKGNEPGGAGAGGSQIGKGAPTGGGTAADGAGKAITKQSGDVADQANAEYTRKATDLVLQHLRDQEHNPDPELANKLQLTPQELQEFARRWNQLRKEAEADPEKARELDEALRSLGLRDPKVKRRAGGTVNDKQRDLRDAGGRTQAPSKYRDQFDQFRKTSGK